MRPRLYVLAHRSAARHDDGHVGLGHVHAFVEDLRGGDGGVAALGQTVEDFRAFAHPGLMGDGGQEESFRHQVHGGVVLGEDDGAVVAVLERSTLKRHF
jgi:hypothetical protein